MRPASAMAVMGMVQRTDSGFQTVGPLLAAAGVESGERPALWTFIAVDGHRWERERPGETRLPK